MILMGRGRGLCSISISGMEVGKVMEGHKTTYHCIFSVSFHIGSCMHGVDTLGDKRFWDGKSLQMSSGHGIRDGVQT